MCTKLISLLKISVVQSAIKSWVPSVLVCVISLVGPKENSTIFLLVLMLVMSSIP